MPMCKRLIQLFFIATFCLATVPQRQSIAAIPPAGTSSANGHVTTFIATENGVERIIISFNAVRDADGYLFHTTGQATLQFFGSTVHADINCLRFIGSNTAVLSGPVTRTEDPRFEGDTVYFLAVDNGEGSDDPPDGLLGLFTTTSCESTFNGTPGAVEQGNIQVRP
jgi:hypothetical protein